MSPDRARTTVRWGDAPSGAPRSHPLTTSATHPGAEEATATARGLQGQVVSAVWGADQTVGRPVGRYRVGLGAVSARVAVHSDGNSLSGLPTLHLKHRGLLPRAAKEGEICHSLGRCRRCHQPSTRVVSPRIEQHPHDLRMAVFRGRGRRHRHVRAVVGAGIKQHSHDLRIAAPSEISER